MAESTEGATVFDIYVHQLISICWLCAYSMHISFNNTSHSIVYLSSDNEKPMENPMAMKHEVMLILFLVRSGVL